MFSWLAAIAVAGATARADTLRTIDGRVLTGPVTIDGRSLRVGAATVGLDVVMDVSLSRAVRTGPQSCVLVDGSTLAGRIEALDGHAVRVTTAALGPVPVPIERVARACFGPVPGDLLTKVPVGSSGLLLRDGDFFEGTPAGFDGAGVTMASPLLGEARFGMADRAVALVLRPAAPADGPWVVLTTDGSALVSDELSLTGGAVRLSVAGVGRVAVRWSDVASIRAGGDRFVSLAGQTPARGSVTVDRTPVGLPTALVGGEPGRRSVCVSAGSPVTYTLGGAYAAFACRAGVPAGVVPMSGVRWSVRVDGHAVAGRAGVTSVDDTTLLCVPLVGATQMTVEVDGPIAGVGQCGGVVLFTDPLLVRAGVPSSRPDRPVAGTRPVNERP